MIQYVVRDFATDIWQPFSTMERAQACLDELNALNDGSEDDIEFTISVYDTDTGTVVEHL